MQASASPGRRGKEARPIVTERAIQQIKNEEPHTNALLVLLLGPRVDEKPVAARRVDGEAAEQSGSANGAGAKKTSLMSSLFKTYAGSLPAAQGQGEGPRQQGEAQQPPNKRAALNPAR